MGRETNSNKTFVDSYGPSCRVTMGDQQMGLGGMDVYRVYGVTEDNKKFSFGLNQSGNVELNSDVSISIIAGEENQSKGEDILIHSRRGNISITCDRNGNVKIKGGHVTIEADGDMDIIAGQEIRMKADAIIMESNTATAEAINGNLAPEGKTFLDKALEGTFVGLDVIKNNLKKGC